MTVATYKIDDLIKLTEKKNKIIEKWGKSKLVEGSQSESDKQSLCYLLKNIENVSLPPNKGLELFYNRNKYLITSLIWEKLAFRKIVNIRPLISDQDRIYYTKHVKKEYPDEEFGYLINAEINSEKIETKINQYKFSVYIEEISKLDSVHQLSAERELCELIAVNIALEIDAKISKKLRDNVGTFTTWDWNTALGDTVKEKYQSLYVKLVEVSNIIHRKSNAGCGNFILTGPKIASIFGTAVSFNLFPDNFSTSTLSTHYVGNINSRWRLFKDPLFPVGEIFVGYSGDKPTDHGFSVGVRTLFEIGGKTDNGNSHPTCGNFDMKFMSEGWRYFAKIKVLNFVI